MRYRPLGRAVTIALWRANNKPPVELVVANLALYKKYQDTVKTEDELLKREIDYADEITYNAKIIVQKYKCFKNARYVDFIGLVGIAVLILAA